jgi:hypothetical protein
LMVDASLLKSRFPTFNIAVETQTTWITAMPMDLLDKGYTCT